MPSILIDPELPGAELRQRLYHGDLVILTRLRSLTELVDYVRAELTALFAPHSPQHAHEHLKPADMAMVLSAWKPLWIHADRSRQLVRQVIAEAGFDPRQTHYDVPKPRTSFPLGHLTSGIAFAFPWHRDVWYSAPAQQINWWLPVLPVSEQNAMSFDLPSFSRAVRNTSDEFDYYENNARRFAAGKSVGREGQARPAAIDHAADADLVPLPAPGQILLFSGAQLHRSIPNTSGLARFSVDFRTVDVADVTAGRGAPVVDARCTGTAIRDFLRVQDESPFAEETVRSVYGPPPEGVHLVFTASDAEAAATTSLARPRGWAHDELSEPAILGSGVIV